MFNFYELTVVLEDKCSFTRCFSAKKQIFLPTGVSFHLTTDYCGGFGDENVNNKFLNRYYTDFMSCVQCDFNICALVLFDAIKSAPHLHHLAP